MICPVRNPRRKRGTFCSPGVRTDIWCYNELMIARLTGQISEKTGDSLYLDVGGVEYELTVTVDDWGGAKVGSEAQFYVYEQIREDAYHLYGFGTRAAKELFMLLLSVSGVGPKVAMAVLSAASIDRLKQAIAAGDPELLRGVSGVGRKTAERVIVELRGKVEGGAFSSLPVADGTYQALIGLGYTQAQAAEAISQVPSDVTGDAERVKAALKVLAK